MVAQIGIRQALGVREVEYVEVAAGERYKDCETSACQYQTWSWLPYTLTRGPERESLHDIIHLVASVVVSGRLVAPDFYFEIAPAIMVGCLVEIDDANFITLGDQDVGVLEVALDDTSLVNLKHRTSDSLP